MGAFKSDKEILHKRHIIKLAQEFSKNGMLTAADGNFSFKADGQHIWMTPSGVKKADIQVSDFVNVNIQSGEVFEGLHTPSSEAAMHLTVYRHCPRAKFVIHAHPPHAIAWTIAHPDDKELPRFAISESILALGQVPIAPFALPGSQAMGDVLVPYIKQEMKTIILARHGAIAWGETLQEAAWGMERIESTAKILSLAVSMGGVTELGPEEQKQLAELRKKIGNRIL